MPSALYTFAGIVSQPVKLAVPAARVRTSRTSRREGGFVLAANHTSNFDPWPLGLPLFPRRQLRFMAKSELYWFPLTPCSTAPARSRCAAGERDLEAIETAVGLCRAGEVVVMFPEGTRRRKGLRKKHEARPHTGAARIALEAGVPLVPAAVKGTDRLPGSARSASPSATPLAPGGRRRRS